MDGNISSVRNVFNHCIAAGSNTVAMAARPVAMVAEHTVAGILLR